MSTLAALDALEPLVSELMDRLLLVVECRLARLVSLHSERLDGERERLMDRPAADVAKIGATVGRREPRGVDCMSSVALAGVSSARGALGKFEWCPPMLGVGGALKLSFWPIGTDRASGSPADAQRVCRVGVV